MAEAVPCCVRMNVVQSDKGLVRTAAPYDVNSPKLALPPTFGLFLAAWRGAAGSFAERPSGRAGESTIGVVVLPARARRNRKTRGTPGGPRNQERGVFRFAVDGQQEMIDGLQRMAHKSGLENIVPILGSPNDPKLPANSVDAVLIIISYHEFSHPAEMMHHIYTAMKQDAHMLIVEYKAEDTNSHVSPAHKMRAVDILREISGFGFMLDKVIDTIPTQHVFVFKKDNRLN